MKFEGVKVGGACLVAVSLVMDGHKHVEVSTYHGEPQPTRMLGEAVSTATATAIPFLQERDSSLRRIPL